MKPEKVIRDGKVAVLVSPGFGAGWSTWNSEHRDFLLFDRQLVELAERQADTAEVDASMGKLFGEDEVYCGGWDQIVVRWLPEGTHFTISEYDGSESLETIESLTIVA